MDRSRSTSRFGYLRSWGLLCFDLLSKYRSRSISRSQSGPRISRSRPIPFMLLCSVIGVHASGIITRSTVITPDTVELCRPDEYTIHYMCDPGYLIGSQCLVNVGSTHGLALLGQCETYGSIKALTIESKLDNLALQRFLNGQNAWISMKLNNGRWVWADDLKEVTYFDWAPGEPDGKPGNAACVILQGHAGWNDVPCTNAFLSYCVIKKKTDYSEYGYGNLTGIIEPSDKRDLKANSTFSVTCIGYPTNTVSVRGTSYDGTRVITIKAQEDCDEIPCHFNREYTYHRYDGPCLRKINVTVQFQMWSQLDDMKWNCCLHGSHENVLCGPHIGHFSFIHNASQPIINAGNEDMIMEIEKNLRWTCQNKLGSGEVGSVGLKTFYECGNWVATCNWKENDSSCEEYSSKSSCAHVINVTSTADAISGNVLTIQAEVLVSGNLEGAVLACFSYNATEKLRTGFFREATDMLAAYSEPIKVIYKPSAPQLTVNYHARPPNVYRNFKLQAVCSTHVGSDGGLVWTLKSIRGNIDFQIQQGIEPEETPKGIEIHQYSNEKLICPNDWVENKASGTCVKDYESANSWEDARHLCRKDNSDLVRIYNFDTFGFIDSILGMDGYWIGLNDLDGDGKLNWLGNTSAEPNYSGWATLVEKRVDPPYKTCIYMHNGKWYTHGCQNRLKAVCETPSRTNFSEEYFDRHKGPQMSSTFTIIIEDYMESATLGCRVANRTGIGNFTIESRPLALLDAPKYSAMWLDTPTMKSVYIKCAADVDAGGSISLVLFSRKQRKHVYVINFEGKVHSVRPASAFEVMEFKGFSEDFAGISVRANLKTNDSLDNPFVICYPYAVEVNDTLHIGEESLKLNNIPHSFLKEGPEFTLGFPLTLGFAMLLFIFLLFYVGMSTMTDGTVGSGRASKSSVREESMVD